MLYAHQQRTVCGWAQICRPLRSCATVATCTAVSGQGRLYSFPEVLPACSDRLERRAGFLGRPWRAAPVKTHPFKALTRPVESFVAGCRFSTAAVFLAVRSGWAACGFHCKGHAVTGQVEGCRPSPWERAAPGPEVVVRGSSPE